MQKVGQRRAGLGSARAPPAGGIWHFARCSSAPPGFCSFRSATLCLPKHMVGDAEDAGLQPPSTPGDVNPASLWQCRKGDLRADPQWLRRCHGDSD